MPNPDNFQRLVELTNRAADAIAADKPLWPTEPHIYAAYYNPGKEYTHAQWWTRDDRGRYIGDNGYRVSQNDPFTQGGFFIPEEPR